MSQWDIYSNYCLYII